MWIQFHQASDTNKVNLPVYLRGNHFDTSVRYTVKHQTEREGPVLCTTLLLFPLDGNKMLLNQETVEWQSPRSVSNGRILTHPLRHHIRHSVELFCCEVEM